MNKMLVFDMDGTIADFYGVDGWLTDLKNESVRPYREANPLYDMTALTDTLNGLKTKGWKVVVTTWLAKERISRCKVRHNKSRLHKKKRWLSDFIR